ncbi:MULTISPECIES: cytochrome c oxidase assembly protein [Rhizobium]|uniref:Cytochrome c oxidase assembly protein CtaG n=1 Tax=Rhizobium tropici TaxID=398 RepID=A0A329YIS8_RHITR|nr:MULTISPECIES: cytochrome c oxidase assembly protein [Rhizobium]MBB3288503.1 cytochrome c oxidase assembly protein subunit 11 [Rhizobium sp. BK252]MBB3403360.1 cytochrome c oxidase assembly protein subunit 11 [Rhizobium sp. BK289]MBB3415935.1 cytochrome c oxidase assembly protein subunit 11 [Rhizobium sp. BK284]MBB3483823.1 cytochrome c oxidase assembly protein subunit 11 [Rhizobium sp. BK347]MDK4722199.1 cytochrome c oxidase assembly protein [Rhizobium sp. CNPSo 3968]
MEGEVTKSTRSGGRNNGMIVAMCLSFVVGMSAMCAAAVPLYRMFCQVTGYNGTTQRVEQVSNLILDRQIQVSFDANVAPGLPWNFKPLQKSISPKIGETVEVKFEIENKSDKMERGQAIFNVSPLEAGVYFNKVQCFCFNETDLAPGEKREMSVVFYVDPEIARAVETKTINALTLSYTYYPREGAKPVASNDGAVKPVEKKL